MEAESDRHQFNVELNLCIVSGNDIPRSHELLHDSMGPYGRPVILDFKYVLTLFDTSSRGSSCLRKQHPWNTLLVNVP